MNLMSSKLYLDNNHLHVGNGKDLFISHTGHTKLCTPNWTFTLSNVLHMPHITKLLLFVQKIYLDNHVFFKFYSFVFYVKDLITKTMLQSGHNKDGFYVIFESSATSIPQVYWSACVCASTNIWHRWLGHPTSCILNLLVSNNKPAYNSRPSNFQCQTCPLEKLSRLSLGPTSHNTFAPLDLFLSDVWGPTLIFSFDAFAILSFFWMLILIIYGFILLLWNLMYFLVFIVFKFLLNANVHVK